MYLLFDHFVSKNALPSSLYLSSTNWAFHMSNEKQFVVAMVYDVHVLTHNGNRNRNIFFGFMPYKNSQQMHHSTEFDSIWFDCNNLQWIGDHQLLWQCDAKSDMNLFICRITNDHTDFIHPICKVKSQSHKCHSLVWRRRR